METIYIGTSSQSSPPTKDDREVALFMRFHFEQSGEVVDRGYVLCVSVCVCVSLSHSQSE